MIINGGSYCAGDWWSKHLKNEKTNDRVSVIGFSGLTADEVPAAFREMHGLAAGTQCTNYFYQANINPRDDEILTPKQWEIAVERLERNLGLTGQPRFVIEHEKEGRIHRHVVWSRIDQERGVAISDSLTAQIHERTSRELEVIFDLQRGKSVLVPDRDFERPDRRPKKKESFRAAETGITPEMVATHAQAARRSADNGQSFKAALEASGDYVLARGDRRDFVIIDRAGDEHSLARRLGIKAAEMRTFMADLDPAGLPGIEAAKAQQRHKQNNYDRDAADAQWMDAVIAAAIAKDEAHPAQDAAAKPAPAAGIDHQASPAPDAQPKAEKPLTPTQGDIRLALNLTHSAAGFVEALEDRGILVAEVRAADIQHRDQPSNAPDLNPLEKPEPVLPSYAREGDLVAINTRGEIYNLGRRSTGLSKGDIEHYLKPIDRDELLSVTDAQAAMRDVRHERDMERQQARIDAPVGKTAGEIRVAWKLSRDVDPAVELEQFEEALAARGMTAARVSADEAYHSERVAAFAKEVGNYARVLKEGEIVVVNGFGSVYRLDERTTGSFRDEIDQRLARIDADTLMKVTDAREAMRDAQRAANASARREAAQIARSVTRVEQIILDCEDRARRGAVTAERDGQVVHLKGDEAFAAALADAGIAIVKVTAADEKALDTLRRDEELARLASDGNMQAHRFQRFDHVLPGEIAAADRYGNVHQLNPHKLDLEAIERHLLAAEKPDPSRPNEPPHLPSVTEARAAFEIQAEQRGEFWDQLRADRQSQRNMWYDARDAMREQNAAENMVQDAKQGIIEAGEAAVDQTFKAGRKLAEGFFKIFEAGFNVLFGWAMAPPKMTSAQIDIAERVHDERQQQAADRNYADQSEAIRQELQDQLQRQSADRVLQQRMRGDAGDLDRGPERERERF